MSSPFFSVVDKKGNHHANYDKSFKEAYNWARYTANYIGGNVMEGDRVLFEASRNILRENQSRK